MHDGDRKLVKKLLRRDVAAFERFFEELFPVVYRFAFYRLQCDAEAAEETTQTTLCRVTAKLSSYRGEASLLTWTLTICRHAIADYYAARSRHGRMLPFEELEDQLLASLESLSHDEPGPEEGVRLRELRQRVRQALDCLHPRHRLALERKYLEERSVRDIASEMGSSEKAVESLLTRSRVAFREAFLLLDRSAAAETSR